MGVFTEYATSSDQECALRWTQSGRGRKADHKQLERMMKVKHLQLYVSHLAKNASKSSLVSLRNKMFEKPSTYSKKYCFCHPAKAHPCTILETDEPFSENPGCVET